MVPGQAVEDSYLNIRFFKNKIVLRGVYNVNYCDLLFGTKEEYLDREAVIDGESGRRISYRGLKEEVLRVAGYFKLKGYKPGTVLSVHLYNSAEDAVVLLALEYIGCVICLIDPLFKPSELNYYIKDSDSKCLITYLKKDEVPLEEGLQVEIINVSEIEEVCMRPLNDYSFVDECYSYKEDELAMLIYTSGSTSTPKGVMLTTGCFFTFLKKNREAMYPYDPDDRLLCFVPFSHAYGCVALFAPALEGKAAIVFLRSFQPVKIAKVIADEKITHIFGVPTHFQQLLRYKAFYDQLKKLKVAFCAAAPLNYDTALSWYENIGIYLDEGFGLCETTTVITTRRCMLPEPSGNIGVPAKSVLIVDVADQQGEVCEDGIIGEIRVKGPGLMLGYYKRPEETAERLKDGYLYTGDLGYRRSDGSFVLCGRKTEFINVAGLKISPIEIEAVLNSHCDVVDSAVIGVEDSLYGEVVKAFVVLKENRNLQERDLIKYASDKLANLKVPKSITFLTEFPRNNIGKIDKKALKNMKGCF